MYEKSCGIVSKYGRTQSIQEELTMYENSCGTVSKYGRTLII